MSDRDGLLLTCAGFAAVATIMLGLILHHLLVIW